MAGHFDYFVILAGMRTGSNFLESSLNQLLDVEVFGEVFNPVFVGNQKQHKLFGIDLKAREKQPLEMIEKLINYPDGIAGFRLFHDHDPRVLKHCLADPRCAKIVLSREPLESYVSLQIAVATGQWKLTDGKGRKSAKILFEPGRFVEFCTERDAFQDAVTRALQTNGQTAFMISYRDLGDVEILNGLARYLGSEDQIKSPSRKLKQQNPTDMREKVINFEEMEAYLGGQSTNRAAAIDHEPMRGPGVRDFIISASAGLIFAPVRSGPTAHVVSILEKLGPIESNFNQGDLKNWKRNTEDHRSFTVLRHPLLRAFYVYTKYFIKDDPDFADLKNRLTENLNVRFPQGTEDTVNDLRDGFESFLRFLKANLSGDTSISIDPVWASQSALLDGMAGVLHPDHILREDNLEDGVQALGLSDQDIVFAGSEALSASLSDIYTNKLEKLCEAAYRKDYVNFGFASWR